MSTTPGIACKEMTWMVFGHPNNCQERWGVRFEQLMHHMYGLFRDELREHLRLQEDPWVIRQRLIDRGDLPIIIVSTPTRPDLGYTTEAKRNTPSILGLRGRKGVGKDTVACIIKEQYPDNHILAFARRLKELCMYFFLLSETQCYCPIEKECIDERWNATPREILQIVGCELIRCGLSKKTGQSFDNVWVTILAREMDTMMSRGSNRFIVTDVRFPNEREFIRQRGGRMIVVTRPTADVTDCFSQHISETSLDNVQGDAQLANTGSIHDLTVSTLRLLAKNARRLMPP